MTIGLFAFVQDHRSALIFCISLVVIYWSWKRHVFSSRWIKRSILTMAQPMPMSKDYQVAPQNVKQAIHYRHPWTSHERYDIASNSFKSIDTIWVVCLHNEVDDEDEKIIVAGNYSPSSSARRRGSQTDTNLELDHDFVDSRAIYMRQEVGDLIMNCWFKIMNVYKPFRRRREQVLLQDLA